jgi:hypothetical protein
VQEDEGRVRRLVVDAAEVGATSADSEGIELPITIGGSRLSGAGFCVLVDAVRLYGRALSLDELAFAYRVGVARMVPAWLPPAPWMPPAGGDLLWRYQSAPNELHVIESSVDLLRWLPVLTNRPGHIGEFGVSLDTSINPPARFFRIQRAKPAGLYPWGPD